MKNDEEILKELFGDAASQDKDRIPEFDALWPTAKQSTFVHGKTIWGIAASLAIISMISILVYLNRGGQEERSAEIVSWRESTGSLLPTENNPSFESLAAWTSPTSSLLSTTEDNIK